MIAQRKAPSQARRERNTKSHIKRNKIKNENEINKYKGTKSSQGSGGISMVEAVKQHPTLKKKKKNKETMAKTPKSM